MDKKFADRINFSIAPVREIHEISPIISKARVRIFYTGLNRNLTYITEEFAEKLLKTLPYSPVGGLWQQEEEDFSDHGGPGEANRERFQAFGVVPENPNIAWEDHLDDDGVLRRYACCDVYLWTARYKAAREIPKKAQSMELYLQSIDGVWKRDGAVEYFEFTDGAFFGLLALGDDVDPCFEGAAFYGLDHSAKEFFEELKNYTLSAQNELIGGTEMEEVVIEETPVVEEQVEEVTSEEVVTEETQEEVQEVVTEETEEAPAAEEVTETTEETADDDANIIFGVALDSSLDDEMVVTVVATGFGDQPNTFKSAKKEEKADVKAEPVREEPVQQYGTSDDDLSDIFDMFKSRR
ncbi:MAG: hypothetical protein J6J27_05105 [Alphaproteobacteria bacterium]|nr:hypothetical protein [Alphaproteobacteria bacterium]